MKRTTIILIIVFCLSWVSHAQQMPLYSQYLYNKFLINPAVAGSDGYTSFNLTAREQWVGYSGAPRTYSFSWQTRFLKRSYIIKQAGPRRQVYRPKSDGRVGMGGFVFSDKNGLARRTGFQASYAYHTWLRQETQLSMGLAFTGYHFRIDERDIAFEDMGEPWLYNEVRKGVFVPDAAFGIHILNARYSFGFSADQLFGAAAKIGNEAYRRLKMDRHYYLFGSYTFTDMRYHELQPSFLIKMSEQLDPQADIGLTYIYNQALWAGLAYRTGGSVIASIGVKYDRLWMGYSFDFAFQEIQRLTYGSHELTIALRFGDSTRRYRWLDRY
ncbi:MAG TPA: type IX secretion system membrane protein PorP/SprF [Bacteroidales bacterium]|nr:type IX secretion system membrane protein PorP/SprF [Bacteroidales bacterium]